jgi:hypothetical protein
MKYIKELIEATIVAAIFALPFIIYLYNMKP